jgi:hypothetical protein
MATAQIQVFRKGAVTPEMDSHTKKLSAAGNALQLAMLSIDRVTAQAEWEKIRICYGLDGASKHARHAWQVSSVVANYPALQHLFFLLRAVRNRNEKTVCAAESRAY